MVVVADTPEHERAAERLRKAGGIRAAFEELGLGWTLDDLGDYMRPAVGDESGKYAGAIAAFAIVVVEKLRPPTDGEDLVARIRNLAHIAAAPGMKEAMEESEVIADTVREVDSGTMYLGIEDEIHAIADAVEAL